MFLPKHNSLIFAALLLAAALPAHALITPSGTAANSASDPTFAPISLWENVGAAGDSTGEYLGNGWIITANHVYRGSDPSKIVFSLTIAGVTHLWSGNGTQFGAHDIFLAQLDPDGLGNLPDGYGATGIPLATATPAVGTAVTYIGLGDTFSTTALYIATGNPWPTTVIDDAAVSVRVYPWATQAKTWGTNLIWGTTAAGSTTSGGSPIATQTVAGDNALATDFSSTRHPNLPASRDAATAFETGAALYDSGSGVFVNVAGTWRLAGLTDTTDAFGGQPANSMTVDNNTYSIDLASYSPQISAIIATPEPSTFLLGCAGMLTLFSRRSRRASR